MNPTIFRIFFKKEINAPFENETQVMYIYSNTRLLKTLAEVSSVINKSKTILVCTDILAINLILINCDSIDSIEIENQIDQ